MPVHNSARKPVIAALLAIGLFVAGYLAGQAHNTGAPTAEAQANRQSCLLAAASAAQTELMGRLIEAGRSDYRAVQDLAEYARALPRDPFGPFVPSVGVSSYIFLTEDQRFLSAVTNGNVTEFCGR